MGLPLRVLLRELSVTGDYRRMARATFDRRRDGKLQEKWTWERIAEVCTEVVNAQGFLPPAGWFQRNGRGSMVLAAYAQGLTWADLRTHFENYTRSSLVVSRAGLHWRSRAEACFSNYLYAREIEHTAGREYPPEYSVLTGRSYGRYDVCFRAVNGDWIDVEIWGDKPYGSSEAAYAAKRAAKERFNERLGARFLGVHFMQCYDEMQLGKILKPYLPPGTRTPTRYDRDSDRKIQSVHWSNADELVAFCRQLASEQPDGVFPTEEWLRKRGKWADRPGPAYNGVSWYIQRWVGGIRILRELLGQPECSTNVWSYELALAAYRTWYLEHSLTPGQARYAHDTGRIRLTDAQYHYAGKLSTAVHKYVGSLTTTHRLLNLAPPRAEPRRR